MCYHVYISTDKELTLGTFIPEKTDIYFERLGEEEMTALRKKFTKTHIYYVGSDTCCSCGLDFDSTKFNDPNEEINKKSPTRFIEFLKEMTVTDNVEYYCCWNGDWDLPTESNREIDIRNIRLDKNYFGLVEKEFIKFEQQLAD